MADANVNNGGANAAAAAANAEAERAEDERAGQAAAQGIDAAIILHRNRLINALTACGIPSIDTRARFVDGQGLQSLKSLGRLTEKQVKEMVDYHNAAYNTTAALRVHRLGYQHVLNITALAYYVKILEAQDKPFLPEDWTPEKVDECLVEMGLQEQQAESAEMTQIGKIKTGLDWPEWEAAWFSHTMMIPSVLKTRGGIAYVGRRPDGYPVDRPLTELEKIIYANRLSGPAFEQDNRNYFVHLQSKVVDTPEMEWIREFESTHDGRGAILKLRKIHEGEQAIRRRVSLASHILNKDNGVVYRGEHNGPNFHAYTTQLQKAFLIMEKHQQAWTDRMKVERLCDGIKYSDGNNVISNCLFHIRNQLIDDYEGAVDFFKDNLNELFPARLGDNTRKRVGENSPRKVGKATNKKKKGGKSDAAGGPTFNGVDCSNPARNFTKEEWTNMGDQGRAYIKSARPNNRKAKGKDKRQVNKVDVEKGGENGESQNEEATVDPVGSTSNTKGGKAGHGFGRNAHGSKG